MQPLPMAKKDEEKGFSFYMPFMRAFGLGAPKGMSPITEKNEVLAWKKITTSRTNKNTYVSNTKIGNPIGVWFITYLEFSRYSLTIPLLTY